MEIKKNKEKVMIELDTVKKDMEKQKVILASLTFYSNVLTRPGLPPSQTASMVLPDLINHETSGAEAGSHSSQGRMIMPPNGQLYEARHRPGAPSMQVHPVSPHHVQAQINQRVQQTPAQFQNTNIYHFPPHHDQRRTQHMVNHSSHIPMPSVQRSSPVAIAPKHISQNQTSIRTPRSISFPEVRRQSTGSTEAFYREISHELQQPSSDVRACVTDKRRSLKKTGHKEVAGSDSGGPPSRCVVCYSLTDLFCSGCQKIYYCTVSCQVGLISDGKSPFNVNISEFSLV